MEERWHYVVDEDQVPELMERAKNGDLEAQCALEVGYMAPDEVSLEMAVKSSWEGAEQGIPEEVDWCLEAAAVSPRVQAILDHLNAEKEARKNLAQTVDKNETAA